MIIFGKLLLEGFGSIVEPLKYNLNSPGVNILKARNGKGKTTIFSGFCWVLYGQSLKKKSEIATWVDKRTSKWRGTMGSIEFIKDGVNYRVVRCEKYKTKKRAQSSLILIQEGKEREDLKGKVSVQKEIINILGFSFDLFRNSVIFGQKMKRIIEEDGPSKKKVFDEAFEIGYIQEAKEKAETLKKKYTLENIKNKQILESKETLLNEIDGQIASYNSTIDNYEKDKNKRIKEERNNLKKLQNTLAKVKPYNTEDILRKLVKQEKLLELRKEIDNQKFKNEFKIENLRGDIENELVLKKRFKAQFMDIPKVCSRCNQKLSSKLILKEKAKIKNEIACSNTKITKIKKDLEKGLNEDKILKDKLELSKGIPDKVKELGELLKKAHLIDLSIKHAKGDIAKSKKIITKIKKEKLNINLEEINNKRDAINKSIPPLSKLSKFYHKQLESLEWLIKDPLSNSGIKAFVFDEMLNLVNRNLDTYSVILGFKINFGIDLTTANKDFYISIEEDGNIRLYEDFSGGEQQLVNICIAFSIHDVICIEKETNLLIMDEVFESLDPENIDIVTNLICHKAKGKSLHIITHQKQFNPINAKAVELEKENGKTFLAS